MLFGENIKSANLRTDFIFVVVYKFLRLWYNKKIRNSGDKMELANSNKDELNQNFERIIEIIENSRRDAFKAVNRELINMYWEIGKFVSEKVSKNEWGKSVVKELSDFIQHKNEGIKGFSASNIWRMKQFYDTYCKNEKLATLLREISWSNNILIMARAMRQENFILDYVSKISIRHVSLIDRWIVCYLKERCFLIRRMNCLFQKIKVFHVCEITMC